MRIKTHLDNTLYLSSLWSDLSNLVTAESPTGLLTEGSVIISQMQRLAKGPQAIRYPNAVVAIILLKN